VARLLLQQDAVARVRDALDELPIDFREVIVLREAPCSRPSCRFPDHDQRDTLTGGVDVEVDTGTWVSAPIGYGSGFLEGDGPDHKPLTDAPPRVTDVGAANAEDGRAPRVYAATVDALTRIAEPPEQVGQVTAEPG
jgi:hypothetical protein